MRSRFAWHTRVLASVQQKGLFLGEVAKVPEEKDRNGQTERAGLARRRKKTPGRFSLARRAARDLLELARMLQRDPAVCTDGPPEQGAAEVSLRLALLHCRAEEEEQREDLARELLQQLEAALRQASRSAIPLVPGEAWCLLCRRPGCPHSRPPDRQHVCVGYAPTGMPRWETFANRCLAARAERVDRLFGPRPEVLALVQRGDELCRDLLPEFGRASGGFRLLAQLDLGYFELGGERVAASFQAIRLHPPGGPPRLVLHPVGLWPRELEAEPEDLCGVDPVALSSLLRSTSSRLEGVLWRGAGLARGGEPPPPLEELAEGVLSKLKGGLERMFRQRERRTRHAGERRMLPGRPIEQALRDACSASDDELLLDPRRGTLVVLGPRGRVHVFTLAAQLVTSLKLDRDAVRRRRERGRWQAASPADAASFRGALLSRAGNGS